MDDLIAKKYAVAILQSGDADEFFENLNSILAAFKDDKFALILQTSEIKKDEKLDFILGFFKNPSKKFNNFLRLLAANSRLNLIPKIAAELARQRALKAQIYSGK